MSHIQHLHVLSLYMYISLQLMFQQIAPFKNEKKQHNLLCAIGASAPSEINLTQHTLATRDGLVAVQHQLESFPKKSSCNPLYYRVRSRQLKKNLQGTGIFYLGKINNKCIMSTVYRALEINDSDVGCDF